jgi:methionine synthase II (cobalamin-independent)
MEVAVGIIDVKSQSVERVIDIDSKIRELLNYLPSDRLLICPSCGLGRRNVELATGKVKAMVQAVEGVNRSLVG